MVFHFAFYALFLFALAVSTASSVAAPLGAAPQVEVVAVQRQQWAYPIEAVGTLHAREAIELTTSVTKKITRIHFQDGQRVQAGDLLVDLASVEERALLDEARINADEASKQLQRVQSLLARDAASQSLYDQRRREFDAAKARFLALEARLNELRLTAPFAGVLGLRQVSVGALVTPGDVITTLVDDTSLKLDFSVASIHLAHLHSGLVVESRSEAYGDQRFAGKVQSFDNQVDPVTRALKVRAWVPNADGRLKPGMQMQVMLLANPQWLMVIPESALLPQGSQHFVYVVQSLEGGFSAAKRAVTIGQRRPGWVAVLSGLDANERVVTRGVMKLRAGQPVVPVDGNIAP